MEVCHFRQLASVRDLERIQAIFHQAHMKSWANETFAITDVETKIRSVVNSRDTKTTEAHRANDAVSEVKIYLLKPYVGFHHFIFVYHKFFKSADISQSKINLVLLLVFRIVF